MHIREHLTYANVMATIAVFGVLAGGGAYAASKIHTDDIAHRAVTATKLDRGVITAGKLGRGAVSAKKLGAGAVGTESLDVEAQGLPLAGAVVGADGHVQAWFNRLGNGPPAVGHSQTGVYGLEFPGLEDLGGSVIHTATIVGQSAGVVGYPGEANARMTGSCSGYCTPHPLINTFDSEGTPANLEFNYLMVRANDFPGPAD